MKTYAGLIVLGLALAACGGGADEETAPEAEDQASIAEPMTDAIDKAEAVEDQAMQHKEDLDAAVEDAAGDAEAALDEAADDIDAALDEAAADE